LYIALSLLLAVFIALSLLESTGYFNKFKIKTSSGRICSLDAFRGFSVFWMIFFNYGSGGYKFLQHSAWDGLGPAGNQDLKVDIKFDTKIKNNKFFRFCFSLVYLDHGFQYPYLNTIPHSS